MRRWFSWQGVLAGIAAGAALVLVLTAGWLTNGMPIVAAALSERARGLLPLRALAWFIVTFKFDAKPLGYWITMSNVVLVATVAGGLFGARRPRLWGAVIPAAVVVGAALAIVAGPSSITYLSARLGAEGAVDADAQARIMIALAITGYAVVAGGVYGVALSLLTRRRSPASAGSAGVTNKGLASRER